MNVGESENFKDDTRPEAFRYCDWLREEPTCREQVSWVSLTSPEPHLWDFDISLYLLLAMMEVLVWHGINFMSFIFLHAILSSFPYCKYTFSSALPLQSRKSAWQIPSVSEMLSPACPSNSLQWSFSSGKWFPLHALISKESLPI